MNKLYPSAEARLLPLPPDLPTPKFHFGQQVQWVQRGQQHGIIRGLQYFTPRMSSAMVLSLEWVGWWYLIEVDPLCAGGNDLQDMHEEELELWEVTSCTA